MYSECRLGGGGWRPRACTSQVRRQPHLNRMKGSVQGTMTAHVSTDPSEEQSEIPSLFRCVWRGGTNMNTTLYKGGDIIRKSAILERNVRSTYRERRKSLTLTQGCSRTCTAENRWSTSTNSIMVMSSCGRERLIPFVSFLWQNSEHFHMWKFSFSLEKL